MILSVLLASNNTFFSSLPYSSMVMLAVIVVVVLNVVRNVKKSREKHRSSEDDQPTFTISEKKVGFGDDIEKYSPYIPKKQPTCEYCGRVNSAASDGKCRSCGAPISPN